MGAWLHTLHAFGLRFLRQEAHTLDYGLLMLLLKRRFENHTRHRKSTRRRHKKYTKLLRVIFRSKINID